MQRDTLGEQHTMVGTGNDAEPDVIMPQPTMILGEKDIKDPQIPDTIRTKEQEIGEEVEETEESAVSGMDAMLARKSAILMEIIESGTSVEQTIEKYSDEIDHVMLQLLEKRIQVARQLEQEDEVVQGLYVLYKYLKAEHDRNMASPALRLLDTLLRIIAYDPENDDDESLSSSPSMSSSFSYSDVSKAKRQQVMARMQMAFDASFPLESDPLSLAHHLAQGKTRMIDDMLNETVNPSEFIHEVEGLLGHAMDQHALLEKQLKEEGLESSQNVREALRARSTAIDNVQEILVMARDISQRFLLQ